MIRHNLLIILFSSLILLACGGGGGGAANPDPIPDPDPVPPNPNTILNGSFETGDYTSWTLSDDSGVADTGIWANLAAGVSLPAGTLFDHQDGLDVADSCMGVVNAFPTSIVSDGLQAGLHTQNDGARHTMTQDVFVESIATSLLWDMAYDSVATLNSTSQYIALNIIDPVSTMVLDTPFKLDPVLNFQELSTFTTFEVDVTPYRGQTIRIELELQVFDECFAVFFDNFHISDNPLPVVSPGTTSFASSGALEGWVVPAGVTSVFIEAYGAGGAHNEDSPGVVRNNGGLGAMISGDFAVTPGETLIVAVGGTGVLGDNVTGGGGGGGSGVLRGTTTLIIAGGGGGAGYQTAGSDAVITQDGTDGFGVNGGAGGIGGADGQDNILNQSSAGGRGWNSGVPTPGAPKSHAGGWGFGGGGGGATNDGHGGGGGGGYSGGGGGWDGGGGGGGSYIDAFAINVTATASVQTGDGVVNISW